MRLFADHDVYAITVSFLRSLGHEVETARDAGLSAADDEEILQHCVKEEKALLTRDKDYANLIFAQGLPSPGVLLIPVRPLALQFGHSQLEDALASLPALVDVFVTIEESRYRVRRVL